MPTITEGDPQGAAEMAAVLQAGLDLVSAGQNITFTKYVRVVLPLDGFVFWVRADLLGAGALLNASQVGPVPVSGEPTFQAYGSLHYVTDRRQVEDETLGVNRVVFTAKSELQPFNEISPVVMFVGAFDGVRFAFSRRRSKYSQAELHHYMGDAIYPALQSQIIDDVASLQGGQIVSNSLPVWLSLNALMPVYPSFLVPENLPPPYAVAHVYPESQRALQVSPTFDRFTSTHHQLVAERVKVTIYGLRNDAALDYQDMIFKFSLATDAIGVMNMPVVRDEKRTQVEIAAIAMKKSIEFEVSYYQTRVNDIAREVVLSAVPGFTIEDYPQ